MKLNIGCGGGKYGFRNFHCDLNIDIDKPKDKIKSFIRADAQHLPLVDSCINEIYASHLIEHLENPHLFEMESYRCLKDGGGILHLWLPNFLSVNSTLDPTHVQIYNILRIYKELRNVGFDFNLKFGAGSRIPKIIRKPIHILINLLCEELIIEGIKHTRACGTIESDRLRTQA